MISSELSADSSAAAGDAAEPARRAASAAAVLVLGMHRSGTSALAGLLAELGVSAGDADDLLPAHATDNPTGYFERGDLMAAHEAALASAGRSWDRVAYFEAAHLGAAPRRAFEREARRLIADFERRGGPWLIKDPRLCLLLPLWLPLLPSAACVVVVRDPREIAISLRDTHRGVLTSAFPLLLWQKYLQALLAALAGRPALFVSYNALLADPAAEIDRLRAGLQALGVHGIGAGTGTWLQPRLRRSQPDPHVQLNAAQSELYAWLLQQARAPGPVTLPAHAPVAAPDDALAEFEAAFAYHERRGADVARGTLATQLHQVETALAAHANEREFWRSEFLRLDQRTEAVRAALGAELDAARAAHAAGIAQASQQQAAQQAALQAAQQVEQHLQRVVAGHAAAIDALRASWSWKLTAPLRGLADLLRVRPNVRSEQRLYRLYYAIPGLTPARKRAAILWLHRHAPWLTRHTLSYRIYQETQALIQRRTTDPELRKQLQRMDATRAAERLATLADPPLISLVMPVYNVDATWLEQAVDSVRRQFYPHWELCIADDASTRSETRRALDQLAQSGDARIKLRRLAQNGGIAAASNAALELASGEFVGLIDHDDTLARDALLEMALRIRADAPDFLYSDEDKLDEHGFNVEPHFKPDFNEDYLFAINYICHFAVLRRSLLQQIGGFRAGFDGAQDYDLFLRATEHTRKIAHIPKVLYHWRRIAGSTATDPSAKPKTGEAGRRALAESIARRGIDAAVEAGPFPNTFRVRRRVRGTPLVSILIPFRDKADLLQTCIESILRHTAYAHFEIVGIDNGSVEPATERTLAALAARDARVRFVRYDAPFNYSAINNFGVTQARGEHLLFLNNDTEVLEPRWLETLLAHSQRPEVGVVGAKLLYGDDTVQHSGVIVGIGGVAGHAHLFLAADEPGYFSRAQLAQNLSAVTFACAMTRRDVFERVGGLNEKELRIAFNDVDFCLRVREAGYLIVYAPDAVLHHYESKSRGYEDTAEKQLRFAGEIRYMQQRHARVLEAGDPYYNPNLSLTHCYAPDAGYADALPL